MLYYKEYINVNEVPNMTRAGDIGTYSNSSSFPLQAGMPVSVLTLSTLILVVLIIL